MDFSVLALTISCNTWAWRRIQSLLVFFKKYFKDIIHQFLADERNNPKNIQEKRHLNSEYTVLVLHIKKGSSGRNYYYATIILRMCSENRNATAISGMRYIPQVHIMHINQGRYFMSALHNFYIRILINKIGLINLVRRGYRALTDRPHF